MKRASKVSNGGTVTRRLARLDSMGQGTPVASDRKGAFLKYAAAFGAAAALATNAEADIIHTVGPVSATTSSNLDVASHATAQVNTGLGGLLFNLDVNRGALTYYNFAQNGTAKVFGDSGNLMFAGQTPVDSRFFATDFAANDTIGSAANFQNDALVQVNHVGDNVGTFPLDGNAGFAGIRLNLSGNFYYGWVKLQVIVATGDGPGPTSTALKAIEWAYNDVAGQAILAGDVGQSSGGGGGSGTPEPATAGLALLALGSGGVLAWRKRRNQTTAA